VANDSGPAQSGAQAAGGEPDVLSRHWELDPAHRQGTFLFRPHNANYLLVANYMSNPNEDDTFT
jgi:phospholipase A1